MLDGLQVEHRIIEQCLPSSGLDAREPRGETSQYPGLSQSLERRRNQSMRSNFPDHPRNLAARPLGSVISGIESAKKVSQLGKGNPRVIEPACCEQPVDFCGNAILHHIDINACIEQQLRSSSHVLGYEEEGFIRSACKSGGSLRGLDPP